MPDALNFAPRAGVHLGAVQERQDDAARQLGHVLRLAADRHLFADAAGRRLPPARAQHHQSLVSRSRATSASTPATNRYLLAEERDMAYSQRLSAGIAQTISRRVTANVLYSYGYRYSLLIGRNSTRRSTACGPIPTSPMSCWPRRTARARQHSVNASMNINLAPMAPTGGPPGAGGGPMMIGGGGGPDDDHDGPGGGPAATTGPRWQWRRGLTMSGFYTYGQNYDNTDGAFAIPASLILANEWGPTAFDRRTTGNIAITSTALRNFTARLGVQRVVRAAADDSHRHRRQRRSRLQRSSRRRRPQLGADDGDRGTRRRASAIRSRWERRR